MVKIICEGKTDKNKIQELLSFLNRGSLKPSILLANILHKFNIYDVVLHIKF